MSFEHFAQVISYCTSYSSTIEEKSRLPLMSIIEKLKWTYNQELYAEKFLETAEKNVVTSRNNCIFISQQVISHAKFILEKDTKQVIILVKQHYAFLIETLSLAHKEAKYRCADRKYVLL